MAPKQQYQIFTSTYVNGEHKECLHLLHYTQQGQRELFELKKYLQNIKEDQLVNELSKIYISKLDRNTIQITRNVGDEDQLIFYKNGLKLKQAIPKVLNKIGNVESRMLLLLPNQEIIKTNMNSKKNIILEKYNKIFYSELTQNLINFGENLTMSKCCYIGELHPTYFIPQNKGVIASRVGQMNFKCDNFQQGLPSKKFSMKSCQQIQEEIEGFMCDGILHGLFQKKMDGLVILEGNYSNGQKSGKFIENGFQQYYHNNTPVNYIPQITLYQPDRTILTFKDLCVSMSQFKNLSPGGWLNQIVVDYYIERFVDEYKLMHKNQESLIQSSVFPIETVVIDTRETSDLFSSEITRQDFVSIETWERIAKNKQINEKKRIIFLFNVDRGHFMQAVYELGKIIVINSLVSTSDQIVAERLYQLLSAQNYRFEQNFKFQQQVTQQPNGYDCAIFTLYYAIQIIRNPRTSVQNMIFTVDMNQIKELRLKIAKEILQQNPTMMKIM